MALCRQPQRLRGLKEGLYCVCASYVQILCCTLHGGPGRNGVVYL